MTKRLLLDTSSLTYRAFFALPTPITDGQRPVNAVRGYLDLTARLLASRRPDEVCRVLDDGWRPAGRVAVYPGDKADRAALAEARNLEGPVRRLREAADA